MLPCFALFINLNLRRSTKVLDILWQKVTELDMQEKLLTPEEAAEYLQLHLDSVRRLLRQKKLPGI
jgi:hypothetical protein